MNLLPIQALAVRRPTKRCVAPRIGGAYSTTQISLFSNRLRDLDIASNAAGDIFQHEMHKRRRLSHELATD
jgi:hypothetical protein